MIGIVEWEKRNVKWSNVTAPLILLMVFLSCGYFFGQTAYQAVRTTDVMYANGISEGDDLYLYQYNYEQGINTFGYSFQTAFMRNTSGEKITWSNYCRDYLHISVDANVLGDNNNEAVVSFPLIYYPGYETKIDGQIVENFDNSSLVSCLVPVGEHHLEASYVGFKSFVVSDIVSLCSILLFILWGLYQGWIKKEKGQKSVQGRHV